ncbi:predicted protein [Chaetoceros tenuissimus]|nr:predicted protein [Chaetoceros tenuissimus]
MKYLETTLSIAILAVVALPEKCNSTLRGNKDLAQNTLSHDDEARVLGGTDKGNTPNGKPFEHIQGQIQNLEDLIQELQNQADTLAQEISDLEERVEQNEGDILTNIDDIDALKDSTQQLGSTLAALAATVDANEQDIEQKLSDF